MKIEIHETKVIMKPETAWEVEALRKIQERGVSSVTTTSDYSSDTAQFHFNAGRTSNGW